MTQPCENDSSPPSPRPYHPLVRFTAASIAVLIGAGALVTTTGSGLSVPDWPTSFGTFFPPLDLWVNGVEFEHTHRLIAGVIALLTLVCGVWVLRREERPGVRALAAVAMLSVLVQAVLGGMTVIFKLPPAVSASHGTLGQTFFCMFVALSMVTSRDWATAVRSPRDGRSRLVQGLGVALTVAVWVQLIVGATMRHLHAGLAIPDFPLSQGGLYPTVLTTTIAINFAHRVGALLILLLSATLVGLVLTGFRDVRPLRASALRLGGFVLLQLTLGAFTVWTQRSVVITSLHVLNGALVLVSSLILTLWAFRLYGPAPVLTSSGKRSAEAGLTVAVQGASR